MSSWSPAMAQHIVASHIVNHSLVEGFDGCISMEVPDIWDLLVSVVVSVAHPTVWSRTPPSCYILLRKFSALKLMWVDIK